MVLNISFCLFYFTYIFTLPISTVNVFTYMPHNKSSHLIHHHPFPFLWRFLLQLVGILLEDIVTKQLKVEMSEQQHTFYCQELGTLLMCLIHIFKSGRCIRLVFVEYLHVPSLALYTQSIGTVPSSARSALLIEHLKMFIDEKRKPEGFLLF